MNFVPFEDFYIVTGLTPTEVQERLQGEIGPSQGFNRSSAYYFSGYIFQKQFVIEPVINYRNSFLPEIKGVIEDLNHGSRLHIKMAIKQGVSIFLCIWMAFAAIAGMFIFYKAYKEAEFTYDTFFPAFMLCFAYVLATGCFKYESRDAKRKLLTILDGEIE